jgi:hypothetical protein
MTAGQSGSKFQLIFRPVMPTCDHHAGSEDPKLAKSRFTLVNLILICAALRGILIQASHRALVTRGFSCLIRGRHCVPFGLPAVDHRAKAMQRCPLSVVRCSEVSSGVSADASVLIATDSIDIPSRFNTGSRICSDHTKSAG